MTKEIYMEAFEMFIRTLMYESGYFVVMFIIAGLALNSFSETLKKSIYPKYTEEELASGKVQKQCPRWVGLLIGVGIVSVFMLCAVSADNGYQPHSAVPGGSYWYPIWAVEFYFWQMASMKTVKWVFTKVAPLYMTGKPREKKASKPIYQVPKGAKVEYVDGNIE